MTHERSAPSGTRCESLAGTEWRMAMLICDRNHSTEIKQAVPSVSSNVNVQKGCECLKPRHHWKHVPGKSAVTSTSTATTDGPSTM